MAIGDRFYSIFFTYSLSPLVYKLSFLCRNTTINRTNLSALGRVIMTLTFHAFRRVYDIYLPLGDGTCRTFRETYSASNAILGDF